MNVFKGSFEDLLRNRAVWVFTAFLIVAHLLILVVGSNGLELSLSGNSGMSDNLIFIGSGVLYAVVLFTVHLVTRKRERIDFVALTPSKQVSALEILWLWVYALVALSVLGLGFGVGLHLPGTIFQPDIQLTASYTFIWAAVNFVLFAVIPYVVFRARGYSNKDLFLTSRNIRADILLIIIILVIESLGEWFGIPDGFRFFSMSPGQITLGGSLTILLHLVGTGIPIMIFVQSILVPRYMKLTNSVTASVILGGFSYATFHLYEFWTLYGSFETVLLSIIFVYLQFTGAGMIKAFMTLRSGNAWTHLWGYHMIAPHLWMDAIIIVTAFGIR